MTQPSPVIAELRGMYREARARQQEALGDYERARELADEAEDEWNRAYYSKILQTEGNPQTKKAVAELHTADLKRKWSAAKTLADVAEKAHRGHTKALDTITALAHAHNREMKTLGG